MSYSWHVSSRSASRQAVCEEKGQTEIPCLLRLTPRWRKDRSEIHLRTKVNNKLLSYLALKFIMKQRESFNRTHVASRRAFFRSDFRLYSLCIKGIYCRLFHLQEMARLFQHLSASRKKLLQFNAAVPLAFYSKYHLLTGRGVRRAA